MDGKSISSADLNAFHRQCQAIADTLNAWVNIRSLNRHANRWSRIRTAMAPQTEKALLNFLESTLVIGQLIETNKSISPMLSNSLHEVLGDNYQSFVTCNPRSVSAHEMLLKRAMQELFDTNAAIRKEQILVPQAYVEILGERIRVCIPHYKAKTIYGTSLIVPIDELKSLMTEEFGRFSSKTLTTTIVSSTSPPKNRRGRPTDPDRDERIWNECQSGKSNEEVGRMFDDISSSAVSHACRRHEKRQKRE